MDRRLGVVLASLLVVLAGCAAPFGTTETPTPGTTPAPTASPTDSPSVATPTPTPSSTPEATSTPTTRTYGKVTVEGRELSFDPEPVYRRVVELHGMSYAEAPPITVHVTDRYEPGPEEQLWEQTEFKRLWGLDRSEASNTSVAGLARGRDVYLYAETVNGPTARESVLAHEFAHVVQHETDAFARIYGSVRASGPSNARQLYRGTVEGTATFVQSRYAARHLDRTPVGTTWASYRQDRSLFGAYAVAPYFFGQRYVRERVDAVTELDAVYDDPPRTTEQLVHGYAPGEEPPRRLTVDARTGDVWSVDDRRVKGELFVRVVLEDELSSDRAADAAAGWGADTLVVFDDGVYTGHAWALRWDSPAEAEEFAAALTAYLDRRGERRDGAWHDDGDAFDLRRVGDDTVVVVLGDPGFVEDATVEGTDGDVTVRTDG